MPADKTDKLVYEDLTFKIIGILFKVHNLLGNSLDEQYYQRALAEEFRDQRIEFSREFPIDIKYNNKIIGSHKLDFIIEDKVILELKTIPEITNKSFTQLLAYLKSTGKKVGILANFRTDRLTYRRLINPLSGKSD